MEKADFAGGRLRLKGKGKGRERVDKEGRAGGKGGERESKGQTDAEKRFRQQSQKVQQQRIRELARKPHGARIKEMYAYLDSMPEVRLPSLPPLTPDPRHPKDLTCLP